MSIFEIILIIITLILSFILAGAFWLFLWLIGNHLNEKYGFNGFLIRLLFWPVFFIYPFVDWDYARMKTARKVLLIFFSGILLIIISWKIFGILN